MSQKICFFCGSSSSVDEAYKALAKDAGALCAGEGWHMIFGGGRVGLMGILADAALAGGGQVTGVIPRFLQEREIAHAGLTQLYVTETMHERQQKMFALADSFVILPGGMGTLAEFFEVLTWKQVKLHNRPIVLVNALGYWDSLLGWFSRAAAEKFTYSGDSGLFTIIDSLQDLPGSLKQ